MITKKARKGNHRVATQYLPNAILYYIVNFFKSITGLNSRDVQGLVLMFLLWGMGLATGFIWCFIQCTR